MASFQDKLKITIDGLKRADEISANEIALLKLTMANLQEEIKELQNKKDDTCKVKESHRKFADTFNTTIAQLNEKATVTESLQQEKTAQICERLDRINSELTAKFLSIESEVKIIKSAFDGI